MNGSSASVPAARFAFGGLEPKTMPASSSRALAWLPLAVFGAWATTRFYRHVDVSDANLYRVLARHLVEDDSWTALRYLPTAYPRFFEHLPFGLWPMVVVIRLVGEGALPLLQLGLSAGTVWLVGRAAANLAGPWASLGAMTTLALTQNFFFIASLTLLDVPLLLSAAVVLVALTRARLDGPALGLLFAGTLLGVATKGPFGLMTPGAFIVASVIVDRSARAFVVASTVMVAATIPVVVFVFTSNDWLEFYGRGQLLASLTGARADGDGGRTFAVQKLLEMFWPGLAFFPLLVSGVRRRLAPPQDESRAVRLVTVAALVLVVGLSLPARKVAHHVFVSFPLLALVSGVALRPLLERVVARWQTRPLVVASSLLVAAGLIAGPLGVAQLFSGRACVMSTELARSFDALPPGTELEVVAAEAPWPTLSALAAERRLVPIHVGQLGAVGRAWALVEEPAWAPRPGFVEVDRARGWVLVRATD